MARRTVIGLLLLAGLLIGLTCEPDWGTAASVGPPDIAGELVGANHAKPLPRVPSIADLARTSASALFILIALTQLQRVSIVRVVRDIDDRRRSVLWSRVRARRGPPAPRIRLTANALSL